MSEIVFTTREWDRFDRQFFFDEQCGGLSWTRKMRKRGSRIFVQFDFEWDKHVFDGFKGDIYVETNDKGSWSRSSNTPMCVSLDRNTTRVIRETFSKERDVRYCLNLSPIFNTDLNWLESKFEPSAATDVSLLVEGKEMHVNRGFLAFHSEFFRSLFQSEFKEKSMNEIPIEDVKFVDFARLLLSVYPNPVPLTEESAVPVLELADRFMIPAVIRLLEPILVKTSTLTVSKKLLLADHFRLNKLWLSNAAVLESEYEMEKLVKSSEYKEFPDSLKAKLFEFLHFPFQ